MDYYNFSSEFADSLDFLSPAAQKNARVSRRVFLPEYNYSCGEDVLHTRKQARFDQSCQKPSSTSLILKKTKYREVAEQYLYENIRYRTCPPPRLKPIQNPKHRPLIRVTVIPNNNTYNQTKLRKRKPGTKKIQTTVSNHESFFKAKNIFLVVGRNKREKIYEIKTTGSEYSNGTRYAKDEEIPLEQNFQQLLNSLNMDKKKKKDKGKGKKDKDKQKEENDRVDDQESGASLMNNIDFESPVDSMLRDCMCSPAIDTVSPRKSRVRITGRIGLTEDDRYVLRCNATIDGKPVESNFYQEQNGSPTEWIAQETKAEERKEIPRICIPCPRERIAYCQRETVKERDSFKVSQRDEFVQTNFQFEDSYRQIPCPAYYVNPCPAFTTPCPAFRSVETQYSPRNVNAVCFSNVEKLNIYSNKDEVVQCNCPSDLLTTSKDIAIEADYEVNSPKSCNSPLVIISVYPKQDSDDRFNDDTSSSKDTNIRPPPKEKAIANKKVEKGAKKKQDKKSRAGSPTPPKSPVKGKEEKKVDKTKEKGKDKGDKNKQAKANKKGPKKEKPEREDKEKIEKGSRSPEKQLGKEFGISFNRCAECCMGCIGSRNRQNIQETTQLNRKRVMNWVSAKSDVSNVAINIDGENEFYDVLLRQGDITTDLQVRKTIKEAKFTQGPADSGSLENFLLVTSDQTRARNRSISQTNFFDQQFADNTEAMDQSAPRLNVRDSIEISHRREEKNSCNSASFTTSASSSSSSSKIKLTPIKHFKGDSCNLPNPVARDKEIRELLGIEKVKSKPSRTYQEFAAKAEMDYNGSLHCFYRRERKPHATTIHNIQDQRQLYMDDEITQARYCDDVDYIVDEFDDSSGHTDDGHRNFDYILGKDSAQKLEHSPITYGCKLNSQCSNKNIFCENRPSVTNFKPKIHELHNFQAFQRESQVQRHTSNNVPKYGNERICVSKQGDRDPVDIIVQCPYRRPNEQNSSSEKLEEEQVQPKMSIGKEEQQGMNKEEKQEQKPNEQKNQNAPLYQQLVLNRNINIYLQIEQFTKQKPIILSHKQYNKVKRTIESATAKQSSGKVMCICKPQIGELKKKVNPSETSKQVPEKKTSPTKHPEKYNCECGIRGKEMKTSSETEMKNDVKNDDVNIDSSDNNRTCRRSPPSNRRMKNDVKNDDVNIDSSDNNRTWRRSPPSNRRVDNELCENIKIKCNKQKLANFYDLPNNENQINPCNRDVNFVSSDNRRRIHTEVSYVPSRTFVLDSHGQEIPTQTNQSKLFVEGLAINNIAPSKRYDDTVKRNSRDAHTERNTFEDTKNIDNQCQQFIIPKYYNKDYNEEKQHKKTKAKRLDEQNIRKFEETQSRKTKHSKIAKVEHNIESEKKQTRKTKQLECFQDIGKNKEPQNIIFQKVRHLKRSRSNDKTIKKNKKDSTKKTSRGGGDESLEMKESVTEQTRHIERESKILKPVFCQEEQETLTADVPQEQYCKRCGRLKPLHYSGNHDRLNRFRQQTCYCYELNEEKPESIKNIFLNNFAKNRRYAASSTEVRYSSVIYANYKHVTFSSTNVADNNLPIDNDFTKPISKDYNSNYSLHTIFKGRRRTPTPNLGTSAYSLCSKYTDATTAAKVGTPREPVLERKPFLKRLMSCLVMRSKTSGVKINVKPAPKWNSANSSVDSYHINTSLGAIEMSSSIYDTSASFYSNHSVQAINSKIIKRGFLSSVRGFLTNRKV